MDAAIPFPTSVPTPKSTISRYKAAAIHLLISGAVAAIVIALMLGLWYPRPYFEAAGAGQLLFLLVGVDVVLGPLVTLIIFNTKKKSLKFDLAVVACLQIGALLYGANTMFQARPAYVVFVKDHFELVSANELHESNLAQVTRPEFKSVPLGGPKVVAGIMPTDPKQADSVALAEQLGLGLQNFPQHFAPYSERSKDALAKAKPLTALVKRNDRAKNAVESFIARSGKNEGELAFVPLRSRTQHMTVLLDVKTGEIVEVLAVSS
jgi:hypothetical protein